MIPDRLIQEIIASVSDLDEMAEKLVKAANDAGGEDNITALCVRVEKD
jgi:serine/threonine protein phosphatase PrpC